MFEIIVRRGVELIAAVVVVEVEEGSPSQQNLPQKWWILLL